MNQQEKGTLLVTISLYVWETVATITVLNLDGILMSLIEIPTKKGAEKVTFELASEGEKQ